jgi:hypothetical protein
LEWSFSDTSPLEFDLQHGLHYSRSQALKTRSKLQAELVRNQNAVFGLAKFGWLK